MFGTLLRKELLANLLTLRLAVTLVLTLVVTLLTVWTGSVDYASNYEQYADYVQRNDDLLRNSHTYQQLDWHLRYFVPPEPLSILCRGTTEASGLSTIYSMGQIYPDPRPLGQGYNDRMDQLTQVDFVKAIAAMLSFIAIVLGFDSICGERERGTLALLLSHPVSRGTVLAAKLAGGILTLAVPLVIAFCLALLVVLANPQVHFNGSDWARAAILLLLTCLFVVQVYVLAVMVSALTRSSGSALIICLFAWLVGGVGYANALISLTRYGVAETPYLEYVDFRDQQWDLHWQAVGDWDERHPAPGELYAVGHEEGQILRYARPEHYEWLARRNGFRLRRVLEVADVLDKRLTPATTEPHLRQALLIEQLGMLSPVTNYVAMAKYIARTSAHDRVRAGQAGRRWFTSVSTHLEQSGALDSRRWFTDDPLDQEPMIAHPDAVTPDMLAADAPFMRDRQAWIRAQQERAATDSRRKLDLSDLPRFDLDWRRTVADSLGLALPGLLILILTAGLSVVLCGLRLQRMDPRD